MYYYCGEQMDKTTGLYCLRARYMNPLTQNRYLYAGRNPVMYSDPSGNVLEVLTIPGMMNVLRYSMIAVGVYSAAQAGTLMLKTMASTIDFNGLENQFVNWLREILKNFS